MNPTLSLPCTPSNKNSPPSASFSRRRPHPRGSISHGSSTAHGFISPASYPYKTAASSTPAASARSTEDEGRAAARLTALNVLAQIHHALGGFDRLAGLVRVEGHVACANPDVDVPHVLDAASGLFLEVLGDRGRHTRTAFTPAFLPRNLTIELVVTAMIHS